MRNPYLFIVGCPRSGTTVVKRILDAHPAIAIMPEVHWVVRYLRDGYVPEGRVTSALTDRLLAYDRFSRLEISREEVDALLASNPAMSYAGFVEAIFDLYGRKRDKELVGDKTVNDVRSIATLNALFSEGKFVHVIRDGRDVCLSVLDWKAAKKPARYDPPGDGLVGSPRPPGLPGPKAWWFCTWADDPISTAALWWEWNVRLGREAGCRLERQLYHELRHESLVSNPAAVTSDLCIYLGVHYDGVMLRFHDGRARSDPGLDSKQRWLPVTAGLRDWRQQMATDDLERFEAVAGELLEELGYPLSATRISAAQRSRARELRARFGEQAAQLRDTPPERL